MLVTRGDVSLHPILYGLPFDDVVVWDNSEREDLRAYGRYAALPETQHDLVYVQDDDCVVSDPLALVRLWEPGCVVVNAGQEGSRDVPWVGWGAVFRRDQPLAPHRAYLEQWPRDDLFLDFCDAVFTMQARVIWGNVEYADLSWATAENRTYRQPDYFTVRRPEALRRIMELA